jgi:hypothetical protein
MSEVFGEWGNGFKVNPQTWMLWTNHLKNNIPNATIANPISAYDQDQKRYTVLDNHLE